MDVSGYVSTDVTLCNRALQEIGTRSTIASLTDGTNEANNCNLVYGPTRDQLLRAANWGFARKTATLTLYKSAPGTPENPNLPDTNAWSSAYPPPPWLYEYAVPSDSMRVRRVLPQAGQLSGVPLFAVPSSAPLGATAPPSKFVMAYDTDTATPPNPMEVILTNAEQALVVYTASFDAPALWPPDFTEALVAALAAKLALSLTGDKALAKMKFQLANAAIAAARVADGNEGITVSDATPSWLAGRGMWIAYPSLDDGYFETPFGPQFPIPL